MIVLMSLLGLSLALAAGAIAWHIGALLDLFINTGVPQTFICGEIACFIGGLWFLGWWILCVM